MPISRDAIVMDDERSTRTLSELSATETVGREKEALVLEIQMVEGGPR